MCVLRSSGNQCLTRRSQARRKESVDGNLQSPRKAEEKGHPGEDLEADLAYF